VGGLVVCCVWWVEVWVCWCVCLEGRGFVVFGGGLGLFVVV
jgi:hypothetical protein